VPASFRFQFHFTGSATCSLSLLCLIKSSCGVFKKIEDRLRVVNGKYGVLIGVGFDILILRCFLHLVPGATEYTLNTTRIDKFERYYIYLYCIY